MTTRTTINRDQFMLLIFFSCKSVSLSICVGVTTNRFILCLDLFELNKHYNYSLKLVKLLLTLFYLCSYFHARNVFLYSLDTHLLRIFEKIASFGQFMRYATILSPFDRHSTYLSLSRTYGKAPVCVQ